MKRSMFLEAGRWIGVAGHPLQGDGRECNLGGERDAIRIWRVVESYTRNLYDFINQRHPNKFDKKKNYSIATRLCK